ncbi:MAG: GtrA family protein [Bosea sp. (in: a-proteobacteria)]
MLTRLLALISPAQRQFVAFAIVGIAAALVHFGLMIGLVEHFAVGPVPATLAGYVAGGLVSYALNRWLTFVATRSHSEAGWRFAAIAFGGFLLTGILMSLFVNRLGLPYLPMQVVTTLIVMAFSFLGHKYWSFAEGR